MKAWKRIVLVLSIIAFTFSMCYVGTTRVWVNESYVSPIVKHGDIEVLASFHGTETAGFRTTTSGSPYTAFILVSAEGARIDSGNFDIEIVEQTSGKKVFSRRNVDIDEYGDILREDGRLIVSFRGIELPYENYVIWTDWRLTVDGEPEHFSIDSPQLKRFEKRNVNVIIDCMMSA